MMEFQSPTQIQIEKFRDDEVNLERENPQPDHTTEFTVTELEISEEYHVTSNYGSDKGIPPTVTLVTEDGSRYSGICGFPKITGETTNDYTMYVYKTSSLSMNRPTIEQTTYSCIGFTIEGNINSFGRKEQRLCLYKLSETGIIHKYPLSCLSGVAVDNTTNSVVFSRLENYRDKLKEMYVLPEGSMDIQTETGRTYSNVSQVTPVPSRAKNRTYVVRGKDGEKLYKTNKLQSVSKKRYTVYEKKSGFRSTEEETHIHHNVLGVSWEEEKECLWITQAKKRGISMNSLSKYDSIHVYDHYKNRSLSLDQIKLLSDLDKLTPLPEVDIEEQLRTAVQEVSYSDIDLAMILNELSNDNGVLTPNSLDEDYQLLIEADDHFKCIVNYLIRYNWASFKRHTGDLLSDQLLNQIEDVQIDGTPSSITDEGSIELVI